MKTEITADQIAHYRERGYVVIDGFLPEEERALWRRHIDEAVAAREDRKLANRDWRAGDSYYDKVFTQRINLWMDHEGVRGLMLDRRLGKMAAELAGVDGINENLAALFELYPEWAALEADAAPMKAGSCSFHNGLLAHGAGANMTPGRRRAMTCAFMPDGSTFNGQANVLPPEYLATLSEGDRLDKDEQNPLLYHARGAGVACDQDK